MPRKTSIEPKKKPVPKTGGPKPKPKTKSKKGT